MLMNAETAWVDRFVVTLECLGMPGQPEQFQNLGRELYPDLNSVPPEAAAQVEWEDAAGRNH